jgi:hypothetical protein
MAGRRPPRGAGEGLLRPTPRPEAVLALDDMTAALVELDANGLCLQWRNHVGGTPPIQMPFLFEAAILSRIRSPVTSRSNWAKDRSTFRVNRPMLVVVLNAWVTETNDT